MSITADPLFVAAEVQWRTENLSRGLATPGPARHHGHAVRAALGRLRSGASAAGSHHGRGRTPRPGAPRPA